MSQLGAWLHLPRCNQFHDSNAYSAVGKDMGAGRQVLVGVWRISLGVAKLLGRRCIQYSGISSVNFSTWKGENLAASPMRIPASTDV
jgi:hypothetical protein